jgi:hypothetical protein
MDIHRIIRFRIFINFNIKFKLASNIIELEEREYTPLRGTFYQYLVDRGPTREIKIYLTTRERLRRVAVKD